MIPTKTLVIIAGSGLILLGSWMVCAGSTAEEMKDASLYHVYSNVAEEQDFALQRKDVIIR